MSRLDDLIGNTEPPKPEGESVDIDITCEICHWPCEIVLYNRHKKVLTAICPEGHEMRSEIGLDWLLGNG